MLCYYCLRPSVFHDGRCKMPTLQERTDMDADHDYRRAVNVLTLARKLGMSPREAIAMYQAGS